MNTLSNKVAVEGYMSKCTSDGENTLVHLPIMTNKGVVVHKIICENKMLTSIGFSKHTKIHVDGRMIKGVIHARYILRLN